MPELFERREKTRVYKKRFNVISNEVRDLPDQREGPYNDTRICSEYYSLFGTLRVHEIPPYVGMTARERVRERCYGVPKRSSILNRFLLNSLYTPLTTSPLR